MISEELIDIFSHYIENHLGLYFPKERAGDIERALQGAASDLGFQDPESCIRSFLLSPVTRAQTGILASHLTVGETYFFRDKKTFDILKEQILPDLIRSRREAGRYLRIWSAGCATGEEPYSIAILIHGMIPDFEEWKISILATDINPSFLRKAAMGIYGEWSFRDVPSSFKERYFRKTAQGRFELLPRIRERVIFQYHNLAEDAYPSFANNTNAMDMVFCRNVLMYFPREGQTEVSRKLCRSLVEGGWLIVSPVEISATLFSSFVQVNFQGATLCKKDTEKTRTELPVLTQTIASCAETYAEEFSTEPVPERWVTGPGTLLKNTGQKDTLPAAQSSAPYENALALYEQGRYAEAGDEASRPLSSGDDENRALVLLARIYADQGKLDEALGVCEKAISSDKLNPGLYYLLATIQQEMGLLEKSATSLKRVLYLDPGFVLAYFVSGDLARRQGRTGESKKQFENALSAIGRYGHDDLIPGSEGITAGRLAEIIKTNMREMAAA